MTHVQPLEHLPYPFFYSPTNHNRFRNSSENHEVNLFLGNIFIFCYDSFRLPVFLMSQIAAWASILLLNLLKFENCKITQEIPDLSSKAYFVSNHIDSGNYFFLQTQFSVFVQI